MGIAREEMVEAEQMALSAVQGFNNATEMLRKHQQLRAYKHLILLARQKMEALEDSALRGGLPP